MKIEAGNRTFRAEKMLLSIGRKPNLDGLRLDRLSVELDDQGVPDFDRHTMQVGNLPLFIAGEHLAHLLAWSIQRELTVSDLLAMPFYHPTVEETLKAALTDLMDHVDAEPPALPGIETL